MKKTEVQEVTVKKEITLQTVCDLCEKEITSGLYYEVITGHRLWGRDSGDSREEHDLCSVECLTAHMKDYMVDEAEETHYYEIEVEEMRVK